MKKRLEKQLVRRFSCSPWSSLPGVKDGSKRQFARHTVHLVYFLRSPERLATSDLMGDVNFDLFNAALPAQLPSTIVALQQQPLATIQCMLTLASPH